MALALAQHFPLGCFHPPRLVCFRGAPLTSAEVEAILGAAAQAIAWEEHSN